MRRDREISELVTPLIWLAKQMRTQLDEMERQLEVLAINIQLGSPESQPIEAIQNTDNRTSYTVAEAAKILRIGRDQAYTGVKNGEIPAIKIGKRYLIPRVALERLLAKSMKQGD